VLSETQIHWHIHHETYDTTNILKIELEIKLIGPPDYSSTSSTDPIVIESNN
jgi:hypothetical protein